MATRAALRQASFVALLALVTSVSLFAGAQGRSAPRPARPVRPAAPTATATPPALSPAEVSRAEGFYERLCASCHGNTGEGDGPLAVYLTVAPRNFHREPYKWRSTPSGARPTVDDVTATIARGVPGAAMPAFGPALAPADRALLARYVLSLGPAAGAPAGAPLASLEGADSGDPARGEREYARLQCASCHGDSLRGDGPAGQSVPGARPYDLTALPPRGGATESSVARALRTGLDGTAMPSYDAQLTAASARDLAAFVLSRSVRGAAARAPNDPGEAHWLGPYAPGLDAHAPPPSGLLTDPSRAALERAHWAFPLAPQGEGPAGLTPAERSLSPERCARCHAAQFTQWRGSVHAAAMGPGMLGQLVDMGPRDAHACQTCHAPLAEQLTHLAPEHAPAPDAGAQMMAGAQPRRADADGFAPNPAFDAELRAQAVTCAACHLRGRARMGPPSRAHDAAHAGDPRRLPAMNYPLMRLSRFERGDFCAPCHQHTPSDSIHGRPVLDTVNEWTRGPYFARGVQCQHCHMPDRSHEWRGAHDPDTVRQAVHVAASVRREGPRAVADVTVENVGAGHAFPGTTTPAAVLTLQWLDAAGNALGAPVREVFQRHLEFDGTRLDETFDTRIAPGSSRTVRAESEGSAARALWYTLTFRPDDYYEGFYRRESLAPWRSPQGRALLTEALRRAERSPFVVREDTLPVAPAR